MAREIVVTLDGANSRFGLQRLDREKLYGRRRRVVVDENDQECASAYLTRDGMALIPSGGTASLYVDDDFAVVERGELVAVDLEGRLVDKVGSTLGEPQALEGPVPATEVLDQVTTAVYVLDPVELDAELKARLERGDIYKAPFNYMAGFDLSTAFLLASDGGFFALIGTEAGFEFVYPEAQVVEEEVEEDPFEDDFDFSMM